MDMIPIRPLTATAALLLLMGGATGALAQGAIKPVEALVVNPPSRPVPVAPVVASLEPVQTRCLSSSSQGAHGCELYVVPAGKRLVIESVSHYVSTAATGVQVHWVVVGSSTSTDELLPMVAGSSTFAAPLTSSGSSINYYIGTHPARIYVDEGRRVVAWTNLSPSASNLFSVSITGHLVDR
jgi:hypothetical protein